MDLQEQSYMVAIADCGSITRAANTLHISQPALSKYLTNLEQRLGCKLFTRNNKVLQPTKYGALYLEKARQILHIGAEFQAALQQMTSESQQLKLTIGIQTLRSPRLAPCIYSAFEEAFPAGRLQVLDGQREELIDMFRENKLDLVLTNDVSFPEQYKRIPLRQDRLILVSGDKNPPQATLLPGDALPTVDMRKLEKRTFLLQSSQHSTYFLGKRVIAASGISPKIQEGIARHEGTLNMTAIGDALTFSLDSYLPMFRLVAPVHAYYILQDPGIISYDMFCLPNRFPEALLAQLREMLASALQKEHAILYPDQP